MSRAPQMPSTNADSAAMRIDKWLACAAFQDAQSGNTIYWRWQCAGQWPETDRASRLRVGDVLSFGLHGHIRIEVVQLSVRRGPASEAQSLYLDRDPRNRPKKAAEAAKPAAREAGSGRPTKRQRRQQDSYLANLRDG